MYQKNGLLGLIFYSFFTEIGDLAIAPKSLIFGLIWISAEIGVKNG